MDKNIPRSSEQASGPVVVPRTTLAAPPVMVFGIGAFAQSTLRILRENGASVFGYLTRSYGQDPPCEEGRCFDFRKFPNPVPLLRKHRISVIVPQSIDWAVQPWAEELLACGVPVFCPSGEALKLERERDLARRLCGEFGIPFPRSFYVKTREEAARLLKRERRAFVIKNPLCGPFSPIHTIVCETPEETEAWIPRLDFKDGAFLQEYLGRAEAGHIALVSGGKVHSLITNQEYKRAFDGNQGIVAGAPLGGLVEQDPEDKYGLCKELIQPLLPWFRETNFHGPVQVTAVKRDRKWHVIEYNVRIGVTSGAMLLRMLRDPVALITATARNEPLREVGFRSKLRCGCSITLAGFGYPYTQVTGPEFPIRVDGAVNGDVWWNEVRLAGGKRFATGHRIADVIGFGRTMEQAVRVAYRNVAKIHCQGSYFRTDIGKSMWPPGRV